MSDSYWGEWLPYVEIAKLGGALVGMVIVVTGFIIGLLKGGYRLGVTIAKLMTWMTTETPLGEMATDALTWLSAPEAKYESSNNSVLAGKLCLRSQFLKGFPYYTDWMTYILVSEKSIGEFLTHREANLIRDKALEIKETWLKNDRGQRRKNAREDLKPKETPTSASIPEGSFVYRR
jgi:hypothetical protein